jgi:hypothetical protein
VGADVRDERSSYGGINWVDGDGWGIQKNNITKLLYHGMDVMHIALHGLGFLGMLDAVGKDLLEFTTLVLTVGSPSDSFRWNACNAVF